MYFGIDLGTTNSVISMSGKRPDGRIYANPMEVERITGVSSGGIGKDSYQTARGKTLPSCVYYHDRNVIVGDYAKQQFTKYPERVARSIKSQMGNGRVKGLSESVPDVSPEEVSARTLRWMKYQVEKINKCEIKEPIITVPANFDTARREATMRAAELAGFDVRKPDGSWKAILISEPNAVLYDLVQKIMNGEVADTVIDFSTKKKVVVFDIGGGTLDVTFHEIERNKENNVTLEISEIATSRFTQLAGDDFDEVVAEKLYERCISYFQKNESAVVNSLMENRATVKKRLLVAAEDLKIRVNSGGNSGALDEWFFDSAPAVVDEDPSHNVSQLVIHDRVYNDVIKKSEYEQMVYPLLGKEYRFENYKNCSRNVSMRKNTIIYPILDVLEKAAGYYERRGEELCVDAVILNGGMSKLYLIKDRIKEFFGMEPITTSDPDLSVANGAAVYAALRDIHGLENHISIKRQIQNEDIYLGLSAGANALLIRNGDDLPSHREITGYKIAKGTSAVAIPIKHKCDNAEPQTIASSVIGFCRTYTNEMDIRIDASFDQLGLLTIIVTVLNSNGVEVESKKATISIGENATRGSVAGAERIIPAHGASLVPANELSQLKSFFEGKNVKNKDERIRTKMSTILDCGNPEDFEQFVLRYINENNSTGFRFCLYTIAEKMLPSWSEEGKRLFKAYARRDIIHTSLGASAQRTALSEKVSGILASLNP